PRLEEHDFYFTVGQNIGASDCVIPSGNIAWRHTRPPVVMDEWRNGNSGETGNGQVARFTTVGSWPGPYAPIPYAGKTHGIKRHDCRKLPQLAPREAPDCDLALHIHPADHKDLDALREHGWQIVDPKKVDASPDAYRNYVQSSSAEVSAAQGVYVHSNSGWFSDRTACYLASARPALVPGTRLSRHLPLGEGLLGFRTVEEAVEGAQSITRDYTRHRRAARRLAEEYFDSDKVIGCLLKETGIEP